MPPFPSKNNTDPTEKSKQSWLRYTVKTRVLAPVCEAHQCRVEQVMDDVGAWGVAMPALSTLNKLGFKTRLGYISKKETKRHWAEMAQLVVSATEAQESDLQNPHKKARHSSTGLQIQHWDGETTNKV